MLCPYCSHNKDKVIDSRTTEGGAVIRRRRHCISCSRRFTTYERVEPTGRLMVIKKDGSRVGFSTDNIMRGVANACGKRPISEDLKQRIAQEVEEELHTEFEREVPSTTVGERVMGRLRDIDKVAYIRFATEHLQLSTLEDIQRELDDLAIRPTNSADQQSLFVHRASKKSPPVE